MVCIESPKPESRHMDFAQTPALVRLGIGLAGALDIYLGYRLFCSAPRQPGFTGAGRVRMIAGMGTGALLAVFGMAVVVADAGSFRTNTRYPQTAVPASRIQRRAPATSTCGYFTDSAACRQLSVTERTV